jgi:AraC-like DNA-binding protein
MHPEKAEFYEKLGNYQPFEQLFLHLPGIHFFVKDRQGRMMAASPGIVDRVGLQSEDQIIGKTDFDFFPSHMAEKFVRDDRTVIKTGKPLLQCVEIWFNEQRLLDWFSTNKLPLRDARSRIVGIMGTVSSYQHSRTASVPYSQIGVVVDYISEHHRRKLTVTELAEIAHISPRHLHRRFVEFFKMSVQEFLARTRIQSACESLIRTNSTIVEIAHEFGFCDQSAFTQQFRKHIGTTPHKFRKRHRVA